MCLPVGQLISLIGVISGWVQMFMNWGYSRHLTRRGVKALSGSRAMRGALINTGRRFKRRMRRLASKKAQPEILPVEELGFTYTPISQV